MNGVVGAGLRRTWRLVHVALLTAACMLVAGAALADLQQAYQREYSFLEAERNSLKQRLEQLEVESNTKVVAAKASVDQLQGAVLGLSMQADRVSEMLSDVERQADTVGEGADLVESTLSQAAIALERGNLQLPEAQEGDEAATVEQLRFAFTNGVALLHRFSQVRQEPGGFFTASGQKVDGTIVRVGQVGAYGVSPVASGALAPAGEGRLRLWPDGDTAAAATQLAQGQLVSNFGLFLFENLDKGVEKREDKSVREVIDSGGVIGWVIVALGLLGLLMATLRAAFLWTAAANTNHLVRDITPLVEKKDFEAAIAQCKRSKNASGRVLAVTLKNIERDRGELEDIVTEAVLHEQPVLDRFGSMIMVVAAVAPLLGLLGTVTGMIATFDIITEYGTGNPKLLSSGIAIALVTTELGLIVAIPALIVGNMLSGWAESIKDEIDKAALRVINIANGIKLTAESVRPDEAPVEPSEAVAAT